MANVGTSTAGKILTGTGNTSSSAFQDIGTNSGLTDTGILLAQGNDAFVATAAPTNGELLIGSTGVDPVLATLTGGPGITITNGAGSITVNSVVYTDHAISASVISDSGSFSTAAVTLTLPASPAQGERCEFVATTTDDLIVTAAGTQIIHIGSVASSAGGTCTSTDTGDGLSLIYQSATDDWWALNSVGVWVVA